MDTSQKNISEQQNASSQKTMCVSGQLFEPGIAKQNKYIKQLFDQKIKKLDPETIIQLQYNIFETKIKYIGQFKFQKSSRLKHGLGKIINLQNQSTYIGEWINDLKEGSGIQIDQEGNRYEGQFKNGKKNGFGVQKFVDGNKYQGFWNDNQMEGEGTFYDSLEKCVYVGQFQKGLKHGKGKITFKSGDVFKGTWRHGLKQGLGIVIFYNGDSFKGTWDKGFISGYCTFNYKNGDYFTGNYFQDKRLGFGTYIYYTGDKIEAEWDGDEICNGKMYYTNGQIYEGQLYKGQRHGQGKYYYLDGSVYTGQWRHNQKQGFGQIFIQNRKNFSGMWSRNHSLWGQYHTSESIKTVSRIKDSSRKKIFGVNLDNMKTPKSKEAHQKQLTF